MSAAPHSAAPPSADRGSRLVAARVVLDLALDLASTPFHILAFLFTRRRQRERFARMLAASTTSGEPDETS